MGILNKKESVLENYLRSKVEKELYGRCLKIVLIGYIGFPDRMLLLPGARVVFVELKRKGVGVVSPHQLKWKKRLIKLGFEFHIWDTKEQVNAFLQRAKESN